MNPVSQSASRDVEEPSFQRPSVTQVSPEDINKKVKTLQKAFKTGKLAGAVCLRPQHDARNFGHFDKSVVLCASFDEIRQKFVDRAKIILAKECLVRLQASTEFVRELGETIESYNTYLEDQQESQRKNTAEFPFKVERFHCLCQTAKTHWISHIAIRERISSDPWLPIFVPEVRDDLAMVYTALCHLADTAVSFVANILLCVIRIAEKCKWSLSREELSALCQGIEDFNRLFEYTRNVSNERDEYFSWKEGNSLSKSKFKERLTPCLVPAVLDIRDVCSFTLNKLLNGVANERSHIMAIHVHNFLSEHQEITQTLSYDFASNFEWRDFSMVFAGRNVTPGQQRLKTKNGLMTVFNRNQIPLLKLEPDSPILLFDSQEQKFLNHFIIQLETSTTLILGRQLGGESKTGILPPLHTLRPRGTEGSGEIFIDQGGPAIISSSGSREGHGILKHVSEHGSPRLNKRVQWHTSVDSETKNQVHFHYSSLLWSNFGATLIGVMGEHPRSGNFANAALGPVFLWSEFLQMAVVRMTESLRLSGRLTGVKCKCHFQDANNIMAHLH